MYLEDLGLPLPPLPSPSLFFPSTSNPPIVTTSSSEHSHVPSPPSHTAQYSHTLTLASFRLSTKYSGVYTWLMLTISRVPMYIPATCETHGMVSTASTLCE